LDKIKSEVINMKIVALYGKGSVGKTTTLKTLLAKILRSLPSIKSVLDTSLNGETIDEFIADAFARDTANSVTNCYAVVEINGRKVGLTTMGDDANSMKAHFEKFAECELCFCAARTHGSSCDFVYSQANGDAVVWYQQTNVSASNGVDVDIRRNAANDSMANLLYNELNIL